MFTWGRKNLKLLGLLLAVVLFVMVPLPTLSIAGAQQLGCTPPATVNPTTGECEVQEGTGEAPPAPTPTSPGLFDIITEPGLLIAWVLYIWLEVAGLLLAVCAAFLNQVVSFSILNMKSFLEAMGGINLAWQLIRDILNIVFVFVLLFVGINTILGSWSNSSFSTKLIPKILLAALLINFSMFFTKVIIDASNILTIELYTAAQKADRPFTGGGTIIHDTPGLAGAMMNNLHLTKFFNGKLVPPDGKTGQDPARHIIISAFMAIVLIIIAMFVFLVMGFMLLGRFVIFLILIITSPIAFIGGLLPQLKSQADRWWSALWGQAFFAPIFFALLLVVFLIVGNPTFNDYGGFVSAGGGFVEAFVGGGIGTFIKYFIVIFLLISALTIAKSVSGEAGKKVAEWGSKVAGGAVFGGTAMIARNTVGRLGNRLATSSTVGSLVDSNSKFARGIGKSLAFTGDKFRTGSFDTRGLKIAGTLGGGDAGGKGGLLGMQKERAKRIQERSEMYAGSVAVARQEAKVRSLQEIVDRRGGGPEWDKAVEDLEKERSVLNELRGGGNVSQARKDLVDATRKLTDAEKKAADEVGDVIRAQKDLIKEQEKRLKDNPNDRDAQQKIDRANNRLKAAQEVQTGLSESAQKYIDAKGQIADTLKQAKTQKRAAEISLGERLADSSYVSSRTASDTLRKGKEKPEETIANEIKKSIEEKMPKAEEATVAETPATPAPTTSPARPGREL